MMSSLGSASASSLVEKATSNLLIGPDWAMNLEICDMINTSRWHTKDVVKAIKKRLQNKHSNVQFLALMLLETMMKNCESVRFEVAQHDVLQEMVKIVRKQADFQVRDKALVLLDSWQEAFGGPGGQYPQYYWAYIELKRSGVQFPRRAPENPLTFANATSSSSPRFAQPYASSGYAPNSQVPGERGPPAVVNMSMSELHNMRSTMELLSEMLRAVNPRDRAAIKDEVINELVSQCKSNEKKLVELINSTEDEKVLAEALALNDSLQNVIAKHDAIALGNLPPEPAPAAPPQVTPPPVAPTPVIEETKLEEDADDEFAQIAQRKSKGKEVEQEASSSQSDLTVEESVASNALVPIDMPPPTEESKPQDMIDLLTLALYDPNPSSTESTTPHQPATTSPTFATTVDSNPWALVPVTSPASPPSAQPQAQTYNPYNPYNPYNQGYNYNPYNNYVASWAQPAVPPSQTPYHPSNPYAYPSTQYQTPPQATAPAPMQRFNSFGSSAGTSSAAATPVTAVPFSNTGMGSTGASVSQPALRKEMPTGSKPYYMPDNLFGDLIDIKSFGSGNKVSNRGSSSMSSASGQPMFNGKK